MAFTSSAAPERPSRSRWATYPSENADLYPLMDGMCIHATVKQFGKEALVLYGHRKPDDTIWSRGGKPTFAVVTPTGLTPLNGADWAEAFVIANHFGGSYPDSMWVVRDIGGRLSSASELYVGSTSQKASEWKRVMNGGMASSGTDSAGLPINRVPGEPTSRWLGTPVELFDGGFAVPVHERTVSADSKETEAVRWARVLPDGSIDTKARLPGADMAKLPRAHQLKNGEFIGLSIVGVSPDRVADTHLVWDAESATIKLVRWSPQKPVDDLPVPKVLKKDQSIFAPSNTNPPSFSVPYKLSVGSERAVIRAGKALYWYDGAQLRPAKVNDRLGVEFNFDLGADDKLYVLLKDGTWLTEAMGNDVQSEAAPEFGTLYGVKAGEPWIVAPANKSKTEPRLYRRTLSAWKSVTLPEPPFAMDKHGPLTVEDVFVRGTDDAFVNARRVESGYGWKQSEPYRVIYRTKRPSEVFRCQDIHKEGSGEGLWAWPPAATNDCKTPFVVIRRETGNKPSGKYNDIVNVVRGKAEFGESLEIVVFEGRGSLNVGVPMTNVELAKKLATQASKLHDYRADVVCGEATPVKRYRIDIAKGQLSEVSGP
jgi:hypothetical protein